LARELARTRDRNLHAHVAARRPVFWRGRAGFHADDKRVARHRRHLGTESDAVACSRPRRRPVVVWLLNIAIAFLDQTRSLE
jgi:hypothetical protein